MKKAAAKSARPTRAPRQARSQATVEAVYEAAARILEDDGMAGLTTARLAEVAGVGVGSIYDYFDGKDGLLTALCERHMHDVAATVDDAFFALVDVDIATAAPRLVQMLFSLQTRRARFRQAIARVLPTHVTTSTLAALDASIQARLVPWLQARRHELRVTDLDTAAWLLARAVRGINLSAIVEGKNDDDRDRIEALTVEMILRLLLP